MKKDVVFDKYKKIFNENGYRLYMVGGTSRDFILDRKIKDYDFVTDAKPEQIKKFLSNANYSFKKYGCVKIKDEKNNIDITTLRIENNYVDARHPKEIRFTSSIRIDSMRRDFTMNAIYIDENYKVFDYYNGIYDINNKVIRMIGDEEKRIKEDPLRILRAFRFSILYDFKIANDLKTSIVDNINEIKKLNPQKIKEELNKIIKNM